MDWETLYCPNRHCRYYGLPFRQAMLVKNGSSHGHPQAWCRACGRRTALTYGTAYFDLNAEPAIFELAIRALAEGNSIRSTARIIQIDKDTVCSFIPCQEKRDNPNSRCAQTHPKSCSTETNGGWISVSGASSATATAGNLLDWATSYAKAATG